MGMYGNIWLQFEVLVYCFVYSCFRYRQRFTSCNRCFIFFLILASKRRSSHVFWQICSWKIVIIMNLCLPVIVERNISESSLCKLTSLHLLTLFYKKKCNTLLSGFFYWKQEKIDTIKYIIRTFNLSLVGVMKQIYVGTYTKERNNIVFIIWSHLCFDWYSPHFLRLNIHFLCSFLFLLIVQLSAFLIVLFAYSWKCISQKQ